MKCILINCFGSSSEMRVEPIRDYLQGIGYDTLYLTSDFDHIKKEYYETSSKNATQIHVPPYRRNISLQRLYSHYCFSKKAFDVVRKEKPDLIYIKCPPNLLVKLAHKYKQENSVKLILDIFDLWPESLPINGRRKRIISLPLLPWAGLRNKYLKYADVILFECDMYKEELKKFTPRGLGQTLYLMKEDIAIGEAPIKSADQLNLCYIGGINNLIDIDTITELLKEINKYKPTKLHIIGDGESRERLVESAEKSGTRVIQYGRIFDNAKKSDIFNQCHFGLNVMKNNIKVGLTLKSIEYLRAGMPLLNNIPADTSRMVEKEQVGFNLDDIEDVVGQIVSMTEDDLRLRRVNARRVYEKYFSERAFIARLESVLEKPEVLIREDDQK